MVERIVAVSGPKPIMEDARPPVKSLVVKSPHPRQVADDLFGLLDAAVKSPGILPLYVRLSL